KAVPTAKRTHGEMGIFCFGLSHQTAAVDVRERFVIPESALPDALIRLKSMPGLHEGLIVSTCNRTEFYVTGEFRDSSAPADFCFQSLFRTGRSARCNHRRARRSFRGLGAGISGFGCVSQFNCRAARDSHAREAGTFTARSTAPTTLHDRFGDTA